MMRQQSIATCALGALAATALSFGLQAPLQQQGNQDVKALQAKVDELAKTVEYLETFADAQAEAGEALLDALKRSEAEGFTAGINPKSREILLEGLRGSASAMQAAKSKSEDDEEKDDKPTRRGRRRGR